MTVAELRKRLEAIDDNLQIIVLATEDFGEDTLWQEHGIEDLSVEEADFEDEEVLFITARAL